MAPTIQRIRLGKFARALAAAFVALYQPMLAILILAGIDVGVVGRSQGKTWSEASRDTVAWFFGNGSLPRTASGPGLIALAVAALLGYCMLGLILWAMTEAAKRSQE